MCCIPQCSNRALPGTTSLHCFPKDKKERKLWTIKLRIGKPVSDTMVVCSDHFEKDDFFWSNVGGFEPMRQRLKKGVLPSRKIPVRAHDVPAKARKTSRSYAMGDRGMSSMFISCIDAHL